MTAGPLEGARGVLLDIEGTTSSVSYVYKVLFPYARRRMEGFLRERLADADLAPALESLAQSAGRASLAAWAAESTDPAAAVRDEAIRLMDADAKQTGLKLLQGLIWERGFRSGELRSHVYDDVPPALAAWRSAGIDARIYSSGSVHAQRLLFAHAEAGDLTPLLSGYYDTATGPKRAAESYRRIADDWGLPAGAVLFLSDVTEELNAAREAGMRTTLVERPGNAAPTPAEPPHPRVRTFAELGGTA